MVTTRTENKIGTTVIIMTIIITGIALLLLGPFGLVALILLFIPIFNDVEHICPVDGRVVGRYERETC